MDGNNGGWQSGVANTNPFGPSINPFGEVGDQSIQSSIGELGFTSTNGSVSMRLSSALGPPGTLSSSPP